MKLGRASAYALLALVSIARRNGDPGIATAQEIADLTGVPIEYLRKVMQRLTHARIVRSERGRSGGFRLRRAAHRVTLLQVVEAIEGPLDEIAILDDALLSAARSPVQQHLRRWRHTATFRLRAVLKQTSLEDILEENGQKLK
jgi:Rrf2 family protein